MNHFGVLTAMIFVFALINPLVSYGGDQNSDVCGISRHNIDPNNGMTPNKIMHLYVTKRRWSDPGGLPEITWHWQILASMGIQWERGYLIAFNKKGLRMQIAADETLVRITNGPIPSLCFGTDVIDP